MSIRIDPNLKKELVKFGINEWNDCFHCGNCTAICPLTENNFQFPRKSIRQMQMGLKSKITSNVDPWLCYYCGECTETCPRDANPGELMMTLRRYLTSVYDWTGLSKKFYTSKFWEFTAIFLIAIIVIALFAYFLPPAADLFSNSSAYINQQGGVMINSLVTGISPERFVFLIEMGDWTMALIVAGLLISNIFNMYIKVIIKDKTISVPFQSYFIEAWKLLFNFVSQAKFSKCDNKSYWIGHLLLMTGYSIMFAVIVVLLPKFQIEEIKPWYNWQRLLGYYATIGILFFLVVATIGRIQKKELKFKFSHPSDWLFIVMLGLTTITGILVHFFRIWGLPVATYYMYVLHLAVLVPMVMVEVPFSKWSHLAYRPFAIYFAALKKSAIKRNLKTKFAAAA